MGTSVEVVSVIVLKTATAKRMDLMGHMFAYRKAADEGIESYEIVNNFTTTVLIIFICFLYDEFEA